MYAFSCKNALVLTLPKEYTQVVVDVFLQHIAKRKRNRAIMLYRDRES